MELGARLLRFLAYPDRALAKVRRCTRNATQNDQSNGHRPQYRQAHRLRCLFRDSHPLRFADRCLSERLSGIARDSTEAPVTKLGIFSFINCGCESAQDIILIIFDINFNYPALFASDREPPRPDENRLCTNTNTGASTRGRGNNTPVQRWCAAEARPGWGAFFAHINMRLMSKHSDQIKLNEMFSHLWHFCQKAF